MFPASEGVRHYDANTLLVNTLHDEPPHDENEEVQQQQQQRAACEVAMLEHIKDEWQARTLSNCALNSAVVHSTLHRLRHNAETEQGHLPRTRQDINSSSSSSTSTSSSEDSSSDNEEGRRERKGRKEQDDLYRLFQQHLPATLGVDIESLLVPISATSRTTSSSPQYEQLVCNNGIFVLLYTITRKASGSEAAAAIVKEQHIVVFDEAGKVPVWDAILAGHTYYTYNNNTNSSEGRELTLDDLYGPLQLQQQRGCRIAPQDRIERLFLHPTGRVCVVRFVSGQVLYLYITRNATQNRERHVDAEAVDTTQNVNSEQNNISPTRRRGRRAWRWQPFRPTASFARRDSGKEEKENDEDEDLQKNASSPQQASSLSSSSFTPSSSHVTVYSLCFTDCWSRSSSSSTSAHSTSSRPFVIDSVGWVTQPHTQTPSLQELQTDACSKEGDGDEGEMVLLGSREGGCIVSCVLSPQGVRALRCIFVFPAPHAALPIQALAYYAIATPTLVHNEQPHDILQTDTNGSDVRVGVAYRCVVLAALGTRLFVFHSKVESEAPVQPIDAFRSVLQYEEDCNIPSSSSCMNAGETTMDWLMCRNYTQYKDDEGVVKEPIRPRALHNYIELPLEAVLTSDVATMSTSELQQQATDHKMQDVTLRNTLHIVTPRQGTALQRNTNTNMMSDAVRPNAQLPAVFYWQCGALLVQGLLRLHSGLDVKSQLDKAIGTEGYASMPQTLCTLDKLVQPRVGEWEAFYDIVHKELQQGEEEHESITNNTKGDKEGEGDINKQKKTLCALDTLLPIGLLSITDLDALATALQPGRESTQHDEKQVVQSTNKNKEEVGSIVKNVKEDVLLRGEWDDEMLEAYRQLRAKLTVPTTLSSTQRVSSLDTMAVHSTAPSILNTNSGPHHCELTLSLAMTYDHLVLTTSSAVFVVAHLAALPLPNTVRGWCNALLYRSKPYHTISEGFVVCNDSGAERDVFYAMGKSLVVRLECTRQPGMLMQSVAQLLDAAETRRDAKDESEMEAINSAINVDQTDDIRREADVGKTEIDVTRFALAPAPRLPTTLLHSRNNSSEAESRERLEILLMKGSSSALRRLTRIVQMRRDTHSSNISYDDTAAVQALNVPCFGVLAGQLQLSTHSPTLLQQHITQYNNASYYSCDQLYEMALHAAVHYYYSSTTTTTQRERGRVLSEVRHRYGMYLLLHALRPLEASAQLARVVKCSAAGEEEDAAFAESVLQLVKVYKESGEVEPLVLFLLLRIRLIRQTLAAHSTAVLPTMRLTLAKEHARLSRWLMTCLLQLHYRSYARMNEDKGTTCGCEAEVQARLQQLYTRLAANTPDYKDDQIRTSAYHKSHSKYTPSRLARSRVSFLRWKYHLDDPLSLIEDILVTLRVMSLPGNFSKATSVNCYEDNDNDAETRAVCQVSKAMCDELAQQLCSGELGNDACCTTRHTAMWMLELLGYYDKACGTMLNRIVTDFIQERYIVMKVCARLELEYDVVRQRTVHAGSPSDSPSDTQNREGISSLRISLCNLQDNIIYTQWLRARRSLVSSQAAAALWQRCAPRALRMCPVRFVTRGLCAALPAAVERAMSPARLLPSLLTYTVVANEPSSLVECSALDILLHDTQSFSQSAAEEELSTEHAALYYLRHCIHEHDTTPASLWWSLVYLLARDTKDSEEKELVECIQDLAACAAHRLTYRAEESMSVPHQNDFNNTNITSSTVQSDVLDVRRALLCAVRRLCRSEAKPRAAAWAAYYLDDVSCAVHEALTMQEVTLAVEVLQCASKGHARHLQSVAEEEQMKRLWCDVLGYVLQHGNNYSGEKENMEDNMNAALQLIDASSGVLDVTDLVSLLNESRTRLASLVDSLPRGVQAMEDDMANAQNAMQTMQRHIKRLHKRQTECITYSITQCLDNSSSSLSPSAYMLQVDAMNDRCGLCHRPLLAEVFVYHAHCGHAVHTRCIAEVEQTHSVVKTNEVEEEKKECVLCAGWCVTRELRDALPLHVNAPDKTLRDLLTIE